MGQQERTRLEETVAMLANGILALLLVAWFIWAMVSRLPPYKSPDYMVSITGVHGLKNQEATSGGGVPTLTLSPVFNVTVRITGGTWGGACVRGLSTAAVSYGDAFLARGSVPPFCAGKNEVQERMATAWGEDVVLPRFLRERLSGELERGEAAAALDVQVTMPADCSRWCTDKVLVCNKVKIAGSSSPCRVEEVYTQPLPAPATAG